MADSDSPKVGDRVKLQEGPEGNIVGLTANFGFPAYDIELSQGRIVTEARYRFDIVQLPAATSSASGSGSESRRERFVDVVDEEIENFIAQSENKSTARKTESDVGTLTDFLVIHGETRNLEIIPASELSRLLSKFFIAVRKQNGEDYEPSTLRGIFSSIDRYLRRKNYGLSLINADVFAQVHDVLKSKQIMLKSKRDGKGNKTHRSEPLTESEVDKLFETGQMGTSNPEALLRAVWFMNTVHFGLRGVTEHRDMRWGDVKLAVDTEGLEYLEYRERNTKTRTGVNPRDVRPVAPRAWVNLDHTQRCPVLYYKAYRAKRPAVYCEDDSPYYVSTNTQLQKSGKWFKAQPVGVNKLGKFMSTMAHNSGIANTGSDTKRLTNHSARKYFIQKLNDQGVPPTQIMQISGHRNVQSVNSYSHLNTSQQRSISCLLSQSSTVSRSTTVRSETASASPCRRPAMKPSSVEMPPPRCEQLSAISITNSSDEAVIVTVPHPESSSSSFPIFAGPIYGGTFTINISRH